MTIQILTPKDLTFNYAECEELYNSLKDKIEDGEFSEVIKRTLFYSFYIERTKELIGCIYFYLIGRKLFVNVFANRGHSELNLECFKESLTWFNRNIYARSKQKTAIYGMLKCGFKKEGNLFVYRRRK